MPGGVNSPVRAFRAVGGTPLFIERGDGALIWDLDGRSYIDYVGSWGPLILGHAHPKVVEAVRRAAALGTSFGAPNRWELRLAELIVEAVPSVERVRLVNSGTEATMSALRLARAFTGRNRIVKFAGCYHGHVDGLLVQAGSGATTLGVPDSPGVTPAVAAETIIAPYNDLAAVERLFDQHGDEIAAVIVEPVAGNMGLIPPRPGFLAGLRELSARHGTLLIFDEVITGFRVARGGAQALYGVQPDLTCLGKVIGGGLPIGAYGGRADIMELVAPAGPVYQAGTLSGNPLAAAAGAATLEVLTEEGVYERLEESGRTLAEGLAQQAREAGVPLRVTRVGSCLGLFFTGEEVTDYDSARRADGRLYAAFFHGMLARGVYLPPAQFETAFVSLAHGPEQLERTVAAAGEAFREAAGRALD
ncbi:MAG: glutamate-1-semialdehyde 2,1-aminomutase [Firmicutes bacterium]|nr:glutamate-1-semialdehyde 2,1-aminomutase [Bacillota bacterium]